MGLGYLSAVYEFQLVKLAFLGLAWAVNVSHLQYPRYTHT